MGAEHTVGAEDRLTTGEPHAQPDRPAPSCVQPCTYTFAVELRPPLEDHRIPQPSGYSRNVSGQPYSLRIYTHGGEIYGEESGWLEYGVLETMPGTKGSLFEFRRLIDAEQFSDRDSDISLINWPSADYRGRPLVDQTPENLAFCLQEAKRLSLGFLLWLQTDAPAQDAGTGFPNLKLRPDVMGSRDGLSKYPYIREARRIAALTTVLETDVAVAFQPGPTARHFEDTVGIGWYPIDIHPSCPGEAVVSTRTRPFQIPLGALIPARVANLIAANKNIGTTHITNGCFRLQPVEWNIGEAAGALASSAIRWDVRPGALRDDADKLRALQLDLIDSGVPLSWLVDVPVSDVFFSPVQRLVLAAGFRDQTDDLNFAPNDRLTDSSRRWLDSRLGKPSPTSDFAGSTAMTRGQYARQLMEDGHT